VAGLGAPGEDARPAVSDAHAAQNATDDAPRGLSARVHARRAGRPRPFVITGRTLTPSTCVSGHARRRRLRLDPKHLVGDRHVDGDVLEPDRLPVAARERHLHLYQQETLAVDPQLEAFEPFFDLLARR